MTTKPQRALFAQYPGLETGLPFLALGDLPTPVVPLHGLAAALGADPGAAGLWCNRDDLSSAVYGGSKIHKLEFLLGDALAQGCTTVLTFGGLGSNHALATAINCRRLGLQCVVVLTPEPATEAVRRTLRYHQQLGTHIEVATNYKDIRTLADSLIRDAPEGSVYEIPFGGSSWLGATGFVNAGLELADQMGSATLPEADVIYMGCGTAGSVAGLALGLELAGSQATIEAVQVTPDSLQPDRLTKTLVTQTARELHAIDATAVFNAAAIKRIRIRNDQLGGGYAIPTRAAEEAAGLMLKAESLATSLTYTAKTLAALIADYRAGALAGKQVLFWNTYNSRPYPDLPQDESFRELPRELHPVFEGF